MTSIRKHSELTYKEYVKLYKVPPVPIIKPLQQNLEIPPLVLSPQDQSMDVETPKSDPKPSTHQKHHKISKDMFNFPMEKPLPEILELNREDSEVLLQEAGHEMSDNSGRKKGHAQMLDDLISPLDDLPGIYGLEDENLDAEDDLLLMAKGSYRNCGLKVYSMNREGNYSSTTGLSRKNSAKPGSFKIVERENDAKVGSLVDMDDFNPKMFKYSLPGDRVSNMYGLQPARKYSEPVHKNGGKTIFGHLESINMKRLNNALQATHKTDSRRGRDAL